MGLDITAYRKLTKLDAVFNADGEPIDPATKEPLDYNTYARFYVNGDFDGRHGQIEHKGVYSYEGVHGFRAGSYSGYNGWRNQLAGLAGYTDRDAWAGRAEGKPFVELVNFSDCEGVIGAEIAAKLAKDFVEFDERAKALMPDGEEWFYERYCHWRKAFEMAADGGAVSFH